MTDNEFLRRQQEAVEQMREMNSRAAQASAGQSMPPVPPFVKVQGNRQSRNTSQPSRQQYANKPASRAPAQQKPENTAPPISLPLKTGSDEAKNGGLLSGFNLPFLDTLSSDKDTALTIGLLLILMSEKADKKLLFALVYILL